MVNLSAFNQLAQSWNMPSLDDYFQTGDLRLNDLEFYPSKASLKLWHFLLSEETRLHEARASGVKIVGTMKDLGTIPMIVYAFKNAIAFYPDGAWWLPCFKALSTSLFQVADRLGIGEAYCPVRAMLGAFEGKNHFPIPDLLISSTGAICDDFKAIAQRLVELGNMIYFWETPHVRKAEEDEPFFMLPDGRKIPLFLLHFVSEQMREIVMLLERLTDEKMTDEKLHNSLEKANEIRSILQAIRRIVYMDSSVKMGSLEMLIIEMLAIHYCSDRTMCLDVLKAILDEVSCLNAPQSNQIPVYWINPVADLKMMNILEQLGGRLCGTDFMFTHALAPLDLKKDPLTSLAVTALMDPMVCATPMRAEYIVKDIKTFGAKAAVLSRIPGASHSAWENTLIMDKLKQVGIPVVEIEVNSVTDSFEQTIVTRLSALLESVV